MYQFEITDNEAGQRLDKYLRKLLPKAPSSFFIKCFAKNIVLNNARAQGPEKLAAGDQVRLFLSAETFSGFSQESRGRNTAGPMNRFPPLRWSMKTSICCLRTSRRGSLPEGKGFGSVPE